MQKIFLSAIIALFLLAFPLHSIWAQETPLPSYIVQPGENLTSIAEKFNLTVEEIIRANQISDINLLSAGSILLIPGFEGICGILQSQPANFGENYHLILKKFGITDDLFIRLNPIVSPAQIFAGSNLVLPIKDATSLFQNQVVLSKKEGILEASANIGQNYWQLASENIAKPQFVISGDVFFYYSSIKEDNGSIYSPKIQEIKVNPLPLIQGHTAVVYIYTNENFILEGTLGSKKLNFYRNPDNNFYYSLDGISAIAQPGLVSLIIKGKLESGDEFSVEQNLLLKSGNYRTEELTVEQTTIEQSVIESENKQIQEILMITLPEKLWNGRFRFPVDGSLSDDTIGFSSYFGNRRSYNNGSYSGYHGGLDFKVVINSLNIYAPAAGRVIFTGPMLIRGNNTFIDHGQGVISGYGHQAEIKVANGDVVQEGQIIGIIGKSGRVTGPHLHWDIFVNGTPVDPFDWLENDYP